MAAGLGYVAGGLAINEYSQKKQQSAKATEWIDNLCNNIPELQEQNNLINEMKHEARKGIKQGHRFQRDFALEQKTNSDLGQANNDTEREAIKAYTMVQTKRNAFNDMLEDAMDASIGEYCHKESIANSVLIGF